MQKISRTIPFLLLFLERTLNASEFFRNVWVGGFHAAELAKVGECLFRLANLDKESGGFDGPDRGNEDNDTEHEVDRCGQEPASGRVGDGWVDVRAVVGEVGDQDTKVDRSCECACTETTDWSRGDLAQVDGSDDDGLTDANTCEETTKVDKGHVTRVSHDDGDSCKT
jgi:hypothetical protein